MIYLLGLIAYGVRAAQKFQNLRTERKKIRWRIHVNGIRGKSTVTRYVAAIFRESGFKTFGKTTGSAARILKPDGQDFDFGRKGFANVNEQVAILSDFGSQGAEAVVMECMAVNPVYAEWLEHKVMCSDIGILTNVRYDHADYLGNTLEDIAVSLARSTPLNGVMITAEKDPKLLSILSDETKRRGSQLLVADHQSVDPNDLKDFNHFAIDANVAIGYLIADQLGVDRSNALRAMQSAVPDPGAFSLQKLQFADCLLVWANLFAVNDRESFVELSERLFLQYPGHHRVVILNNRQDRQIRVRLFTELSVSLSFDTIVTFGDFESEVNQCLAQHQRHALNLGNSSVFRELDGAELLAKIIQSTGSSKPILLIGTVNIHTSQAEKLLHHMANLDACI